VKERENQQREKISLYNTVKEKFATMCTLLSGEKGGGLDRRNPCLSTTLARKEGYINGGGGRGRTEDE